MADAAAGRIFGTVKWFNTSKGYGFITPDPAADGSGMGVDELFAHQTAIKMDGFRVLNEGDRVSFRVEQGPKGLQAVDIILLPAAEPGSADN